MTLLTVLTVYNYRVVSDTHKTFIKGTRTKLKTKTLTTHTRNAKQNLTDRWGSAARKEDGKNEHLHKVNQPHLTRRKPKANRRIPTRRKERGGTQDPTTPATQLIKLRASM